MSIRDRVREGSFFERLHRYPKRGWIAGVCVGLAEFFDWNVKLIRVLFAAALVFGGFFPAGVIYLVLWYLMDEPTTEGERPRGFDDSSRNYDRRAEPPNPTELKVRFARLEARLRNMEDCVTSRDFELRRELKKLEG